MMAKLLLTLVAGFIAGIGFTFLLIRPSIDSIVHQLESCRTERDAQQPTPNIKLGDVIDPSTKHRVFTDQHGHRFEMLESATQ